MNEDILTLIKSDPELAKKIVMAGRIREAEERDSKPSQRLEYLSGGLGAVESRTLIDEIAAIDQEVDRATSEFQELMRPRQELVSRLVEELARRGVIRDVRMGLTRKDGRMYDKLTSIYSFPDGTVIET